MTTRELLAALADLAADHDGPLEVDELLDATLIRCRRCGTVSWPEGCP